jgi:amino acid adenylation domain-containing protein
MKAGGAYVPLDPAYPAERLAFMLEDAGVPVLVTEERLLPTLHLAFGITDRVSRQKPFRIENRKSNIPTVMCLEDNPEMCAAESEQNPVSGATAANRAYVIYTSGSTGKPKGVMITHANLCHYAHAMQAALGITADDCYLHTASFAFSSSVRQFAVPLSCGATIVVAPTEQIRDPRTLFEVIRQQGVSIIDIVPSYWRNCNQVLASLEPASRADLLRNRLRLILSASEPLFSDVPREWGLGFQHGARLINMFGQTETAGIVTVYPIASHDGGSVKVVPIGRPIANTRAYVLDSSGQPAPLGVWGELHIGGASVGRGYLNQPELTAEQFVPDPFSETPGERLYRTGDVTRYLPDGNIEFSGRVDHQMKLHGFRIEPAEIEAVVGQHPGVRESAVVTQKDTTGEKRLVAYVVPNSGIQGFRGSDVQVGPPEHVLPSQREHLTRELREFLRQKLPEYMVPSLIVELAALPRTPNGKVDRVALCTHFQKPFAPSTDTGCGTGSSSPEGARTELEAGHVVPLTPAEEILTAVWAQVLHVDRVGLDDNFFDMGGDSILSVQVINRANQAGLRLSPKQLFQHQTIAELARVAVAGTSRSSAAQTERGVVTEPVQRRDPAVADDAQPGVRVTIESLRSYGREALERAGLAPEGAAIVTEVQLEASLRGQPTHNMVAIPRYARRIASGAMNPRPHIRIEHETEISAHVDGDNGPGQWIGVMAMELAIRIARERGVGMVGAHRSNHLGAAGHYAWLAAREGLIGLCTTNGPVILAPTGGLTPTFGNNPLGVGIPARRYHPILLDIAMSVAPRGKIGVQLAEGKPLPPGWILDRFGHPSTDPADLAAGLGVPIGGHKGYGLTLVMEVLAGVLTGAGFGWDHRRGQTRQSAKPPDLGHFFMAIDPELFMPTAEFTARVDHLIEQTKAGERAENVEEILIPGEMEMRAREQNLREGVPLPPLIYHALRKYARKAGLDSVLTVVRQVESLEAQVS